MTQDQAMIYNMAICHALASYNHGYGAIAALKVPFTVTVDNMGHSTKQDVVYDAD